MAANTGIELERRDALSLAETVRAGRRTATEVIGQSLAAAERSPLGAFWAVDREGATRAATKVDELRAAGRPAGALAGVPVAVKDCFDLVGLATSGGVAGERQPARSDAEAVRRLRAAGAVPLGKAAMDQLGWSLAGTAPGFPDCRNPIDPELSPGGSSCGSAVAVAAGLAALGLGTDVAGSVRVPAAFCGVVGLKPPDSSIPLDGALEFAPSFDLACVIATSVRACVAAYGLLAAVAPPAPEAPERVGILEDQLEGSDPNVATVVERAAGRLERAGVRTEPVRLDWSAPGFGRILAAELARTWGPEVRRSPANFTEDVRRSVEHGARVTDAQADDFRRALSQSAREVARRLEGFDVLIGPTVPIPVPSVDRPRSVDELTAHTRPFSALGWPAASVPVGRDPVGRPVGIQIASAPHRLGRLIAVATALEP